jgi:hypothetical protein
MSTSRVRTALLGALVLSLAPLLLVTGPNARAEQAASRVDRLAAASLDTGGDHACVILAGGAVRCWGHNFYGNLGYGNTDIVGDNEAPASAGPVNLGTGRTAVALAGGSDHTCAILDNRTVRCWGANSDGQLGYGNTDTIGDNEAPASAGPVNLGTGRTAIALAAGYYHTCAILDNGTVRCWGENSNGQLGYGNLDNIGDNETPAAAGPVNLGAGLTAVALAAGDYYLSAILDNGTVRCWGYNGDGQLGYGNTDNIGDNETPASAGPVNLGAGRTAVALSAGYAFTCAVLDNRTVRCWGDTTDGQLGYGNTTRIGDDETPASAGPAYLGAAVRTFEQPSLALTATPHRDRRPKYKFKVTGALTGRFIRDGGTCNGTARIVATTGKGRHKRVLKRLTTTVRGTCTLSARVVITRKKLHTTRSKVPIKIKVTYLGNRSLAPATAVKKVRAR